MKNVLMLAHDDLGQEARFQAALDLTRAISGHLHCLDVTPPPLFADPLIGAGFGAVVYDETDRETENAARLKRRLAEEDVAWSWEDVRGEFSTCLLEAGRSADVIVLNRGLDDYPSPEMRTIIGEVLINSAALVLAVAGDCRRLTLGGPAIVAWNGSERIMRALRRAVPLLSMSSTVVILQVGQLPDDALDANEAAAYLSRHGIKPEVQVNGPGAGAAAEIAHAAGRLGAAYCVMGGFGHSRLREAVFGGVTNDLLTASGVPLVIGH